MEIKPATALSPATPSADAYFDLVSRLRALDGVEVEILRRAPGWMVLRTPLGKLLTANSLPLRDGERLRLRVTDHGGQPLLKLAPIARRAPAPLTLDAGAHPRLAAAVQAAAGRVLLGTVDGGDARALNARFASGAERLPPITGAARGDWLLLRGTSAGGRLEVSAVEREAVNRALLRRLLPDLQGAPGNNLPRLARLLLRGIDALSRQPAAARPAPAGADNAATRTAAASPPGGANAAAKPAPGGPARAASSAPAGAASPAPNLQQLFDLLPRLPGLDAAAIRKWFEFLQLARPAADAADRSAATNLPTLLHRLLDTERLGNELRAAARARGPAPELADDADAPLQREAITQLARDVARLAEQGLAQNLGGRASAGLQQDGQQPFAISLTVPLLEREDVQPLRIDLKQRGRGGADCPSAWEIRLEFDFDGLGVIACHGVLAERRVQASFYSAVPATRAGIEAALPELVRRLQLAGFETGEFHSFAGAPPDAGPAPAPSGLIDVRA